MAVIIMMLFAVSSQALSTMSGIPVIFWPMPTSNCVAMLALTNTDQGHTRPLVVHLGIWVLAHATRVLVKDGQLKASAQHPRQVQLRLPAGTELTLPEIRNCNKQARATIYMQLLHVISSLTSILWQSLRILPTLSSGDTPPAQRAVIRIRVFSAIWKN